MFQYTGRTPLNATSFHAEQPLGQGLTPRTEDLPERKATYVSRWDIEAAMDADKAWARVALDAIGLARRHRHLVALLFLDLDAFKPINDSLGHALGDMLLQAVASRLQDCMRDIDTVCRHGGDEFVVLLAEIRRPEDATRVAEKLLAVLGRPYCIQGHAIFITLSIGISLYPDDAEDADTLMHNADTAMYHAKRHGRNGQHCFTAEVNTHPLQCRRTEPGLHLPLQPSQCLLDF